jgi:hypothetical protein
VPCLLRHVLMGIIPHTAMPQAQEFCNSLCSEHQEKYAHIAYSWSVFVLVDEHTEPLGPAKSRRGPPCFTKRPPPALSCAPCSVAQFQPLSWFTGRQATLTDAMCQSPPLAPSEQVENKPYHTGPVASRQTTAQGPLLPRPSCCCQTTPVLRPWTTGFLASRFDTTAAH